jgi:flagellar basal body-associated protein FliL
MWLILAISILIILVLVIIIIVLLMSSKEEKGKDEEDVIPSRGDPIGEIICILDVNTIKEKTNIIGHDFNL